MDPADLRCLQNILGKMGSGEIILTGTTEVWEPEPIREITARDGPKLSPGDIKKLTQ